MSYEQIMGLGSAEGGAKSVNVPVLNKGSRAEFLAFMQTSEVNDSIKQLIANGKLKLADGQYYATKLVSGKTVKMFEPQDSKEVGLGNIDRARLPKNTVFLCTGMQILAAHTYGEFDNAGALIYGADEEFKAKQAKFYPIDKGWPTAAQIGVDTDGNVASFFEGETASATTLGALMYGDDFQPFSGLETGELTLRANRTDLITDFPLSAFKEDKNSVYPPGFVKFDNPRLIQDDTEIELDIELGEDVLGDYPPDEAVWLKIVMHGTHTIPA